MSVAAMKACQSMLGLRAWGLALEKKQKKKAEKSENEKTHASMKSSGILFHK